MGLLPPPGRVTSAPCSKAGHFTSLLFWKCFLLKHNSLSTCYFHHSQLVLVYSFNKYYLVTTMVSGEVLGIGDKKMKMLESLSEDISSEVLAEHLVNYNHELGDLCQNRCVMSTKRRAQWILQWELGREVGHEKWELEYQVEKQGKHPGWFHSFPYLKHLHPVCPLDTRQLCVHFNQPLLPSIFIFLEFVTLCSDRFSLTHLHYHPCRGWFKALICPCEVPYILLLTLVTTEIN